jgi:hypothetical protein
MVIEREAYNAGIGRGIAGGNVTNGLWYRQRGQGLKTVRCLH